MRPQQAKRDLYRRKALREGYRSRAAYKLMQLDDKFGLIHEGDTVLDVGCAPGGWLQVESERVGPQGRVVGVDLNPVEPPSGNVETVVLDITSPAAPGELKSKLPEGADAVFSDLSPTMMGVWEVDSGKQIDMTRAAFEIACSVLKKGKGAAFKIFEGEFTDEFVRYAKPRFQRTDLAKPEASRKQSSELYFVGLGFEG
ncbi:MAG TPA: RlmE family RNA methyltransferase [Conexivisphaerales archaeon]|nr:RlmE family RNA methyltransferase [Conexivisphaerales archaeon]